MDVYNISKKVEPMVLGPVSLYAASDTITSKTPASGASTRNGVCVCVLACVRVPLHVLPLQPASIGWLAGWLAGCWFNCVEFCSSSLSSVCFTLKPNVFTSSTFSDQLLAAVWTISLLCGVANVACGSERGLWFHALSNLYTKVHL